MIYAPNHTQMDTDWAAQQKLYRAKKTQKNTEQRETFCKDIQSPLQQPYDSPHQHHSSCSAPKHTPEETEVLCCKPAAFFMFFGDFVFAFSVLLDRSIWFVKCMPASTVILCSWLSKKKHSSFKYLLSIASRSTGSLKQTLVVYICIYMSKEKFITPGWTHLTLYLIERTS